ncbi:MAG: GNAT family N-acetyltransferase [Spirochaetes bacterium]|nr:GNAT family N-acetyltransferase [Spirochaetota bacterium]
MGILSEAQLEGRLWVALADDVPVGFALVTMIARGHPHLQEMDVLPGHGRRGLGTALLRAVCAWASEKGYREITLTTFRAVAWNMPFYGRLGFVEVPGELQGPELREIVKDETSRGLDPLERVVMTYVMHDVAAP